MAVRTALGTFGERLAEEYLVERGAVVVARQWRCRAGELDLVVWDGPVLVAVEVKTRRGLGFGFPLEAVTARKQVRLRRALLTFVDRHVVGRPALRIDGIGISWSPGLGGSTPQVEHVRGVA
jgi:putative endonuclease